MSKIIKGKEAWDIYNSQDLEDYFVHSERDDFYWVEVFCVEGRTHTFYINDHDPKEITLEIE